MRLYQELVYGRKTLQENFNTCVQEMLNAGLTDDEMEEMTSTVLIPEIARSFAVVYEETYQDIPQKMRWLNGVYLRTSLKLFMKPSPTLSLKLQQMMKIISQLTGRN